MNRLKLTDNGGMELHLDDFRWQDEGIREGFKGLAKAFGDNFIIEGAVASVSGSVWTVGAGWVVLAGEVLKMDAQAAIDTATYPHVYVELDITYDPTGYEVFENNTPHDTYEIRKAKVVGYTTAQSGKVQYITMALNTVDAIINNKIVDVAHNFTKRQSFAKGTGNAIGSGQNYISCSVDTGNSFEVNLSSANTPINRFNPPFPQGTFVMVRFTGSGQVVIEEDSVTNPIDTNGKSYVFKAGETAIFWVGGSNTHYLVNGFRLNEPLVLVNSGSAPALASGWSGTNIRYKKDELGRVTLMGQAGHNTYTTGTNNAIFTLPVGYRPSQNLSFDRWERIHNDKMGTINIGSNGVVSFYVDAYSAAAVNATLDGISFLI